MNKIGRNDPCPSGTGNKFKKCLAAHPCLGIQSSTAEIWWVCERWQTQTPPFLELRAALPDMAEICPAKFDAFLEMAFAASPSTVNFWGNLFTECRAKRHPDLPGIFRRMSSRLSAAGSPELPWFYSSAATCLWEAHPEMFPEVLAATLALAPATTPMESLELLVKWAVDLERKDDCELLRRRFPEFPEYMLMQPEDDSAETEADRDEPEPNFPAEVIAALNTIWDDFEALETPSLEQADAFVDALLALPHEATEWNEVFDVVQRCGHGDTFTIFHRLAAALAPTRNNDFAFVCWAAAEMVESLKTPERLPEIARALLDFNPQACDADALSHIADALLAHGYVHEMIGLLIGFLPNLRDNGGLLGWVVPRLAEEILLLRIGVLISSGDYSLHPIDQLLAGLRAGLNDDICQKSASVPLQYLVRDREDFSRERFMLPSSTKDAAKREDLWNDLQQAFVEVARDAWQTERLNPSQTLIGLHMILRSAEHRLDNHREKGGKYPLNLLDYLNSAAMDRLVVIECSNLFGLNPHRSRIMLEACATLIRWTGRRGLLSETDTAKAGRDMGQLMKKLGL